MKKYHFIAMNRQMKIIHKSESYNTYREALDAGCIYLEMNKEVKEISVR